MIKKKEFITIVIDPNNETFIVIVVFYFSFNKDIDVNYFCRAQIASLIVYKVLTIVLSKFTNFANIIFPDFVAKLYKYTKINNYLIYLVKDKQSLYLSF